MILVFYYLHHLDEKPLILLMLDSGLHTNINLWSFLFLIIPIKILYYFLRLIILNCF